MNEKSIQIFRDKAFDSLTDAEVLFNHERFAGCINRCYYAIFHMVQALLASKNIFNKSHNGLHHLFSEHFIKTKIFDTDMQRLLMQLYELRQTGDYDYEDFNEAETKIALEKTKLFLNRAKPWLDNSNYFI